MKRAVERIMTWILILTMVVGFLPPMQLHVHAAEPSVNASQTLELRYDDRYPVNGKEVEILEGSAVRLTGDCLIAVEIGTAKVRIDGVLYEVKVDKAKINLVMIMGQSNAGNHFANATSAVTCPPGTAYWWKDGATAPVDYTEPSKGFHTPLLAELYAQSAAAGDPVKNVMLWTEGATSKNGQSIVKWAVESGSGISTAGTDKATAMMKNCLSYYQQHSDTYEIIGKYVYWLQGESDYNMDPQRYIRLFTAMWERLKGEGMEELAFLRVRGPTFNNTDQNMDTVYNAASAAQFEMVRSREDMFMATTLTEAWTGPVNTSHSVDVSDYITVKETYGKSPTYSDSYGNKATYADGVLTTTMKELYGSNNKVHYGIFGYGLIGADAAYNMYRSLGGTGSVTFVQTDTSGKKEAEHIAVAGTVQVLDIENLTHDLSFYPGCGSPAGTMQIAVSAQGKDITDQVVSKEKDHYGAVSVNALRNFLDPVITVSYIHGGVTDCVTYKLQFEHPCQNGHAYTTQVTPPTCTEKGYTIHTCACGHSYIDNYTDPRPLNILMIGNSFSWDAADFWYDMQESMTYNTMKAMISDQYDIHLAVMYKGSATLAYHATCAMNNTGDYTFTEIGPETNYRWAPSSGKNNPQKILAHLNERDWDIIVVQGYQHEADGTEPRSTYTGGDARFSEPSASLGYLLDYFQQKEPDAEVYYYMPWSTVKFYGADGTAAGYEAIAKFTSDHISGMTGTSSGKALAGIIPVGTGIQNARTTYLNSLKYSAGTGSTALLKDPQIGLLYDSQHLSFGIGRYIAGAVVAECLIPAEMRAEQTRWTSIKDSPSVGKLPEEYTTICRIVAENAVRKPYQVTAISGYDQDPADRLAAKLESADFTGSGIKTEEQLRTHIDRIISNYLSQNENAVIQITINDYRLENGQIMDLDATVSVRIGYSARTAQLTVMDGTKHRFGEWTSVSAPTENALGKDRRVCQICGLEETRNVEGSWQKYDLANHIQQIPCKHGNIWDMLEPESVMIDQNGKWVSAGTKVYSITIPVTPGDKIYANSFAAKGIQVSFIGVYGIVKTTFSSQTLKEFNDNGGYLVVPEDAFAVNIPVWNVNDPDNTVKLLNYSGKITEKVVAPTCSEQGYTEYTCSCGYSYKDELVPATGHKWTAATCDKAKTCSVCKKTEGSALGHKWSAATCDKAKTCSVCGKTEGSALGHKWTAATCDKAKTCSVCGKTEGTPRDHVWDKGTVTKPATETAEGVMTYKCTACGETKTAAIPVLSHTHKYEKVVTKPTCTDQGYTTHTCVCGDSYTDSYVAALDHRYQNGHCTSCGAAAPLSEWENVDLFVFAGQSNMMGAATLEPETNTFTDMAWEYKYLPKLRGEETGSFVSAQNPAGEWHYMNLDVAYGNRLYDLTYRSTLTNYTQNTYFCPAMSSGVKSYGAQSEADTYPSASLAPYFVTEYAQYGHGSVYAHMAKGAVSIVHYFAEERMERYNELIGEYNAQNKKSYNKLTLADLSGAGAAFDSKYNSLLADLAVVASETSANNKCFVWLQGEGDGGRSYIEYKFKMQVLWEHLQDLGFTHFFVLRVGYWGNSSILNVIKAQEDFCAENENCHIVTRAPSLIPYPGATTENWWINEPSSEYENCRDSYLVNTSNQHFNEKAMQLFAERSAENIHRILYLGLDPILEEENIQGMVPEIPEEDSDDTTPYTSYIGADDFQNRLSVSKSNGVWKVISSSSAASTDLIPVKSSDSVWLQYVFIKSEAHAVGGFFDDDGNLVAPLYYKDFGFSLDGNTGGTTAFRRPSTTNRVSVADVEASTDKKIAYVRFTAWEASAGGHANTEARIYHDALVCEHKYQTSVIEPTCTEPGYSTHNCSVCSDRYMDTQTAAKGHNWSAATCETAKTCSVCKKTEGSALGHKWNAATCDKAKTCSVCKKTEGSALGHKWVAATCDKAKTCSVCKKTEGSALGHKWSAATCETAKTCSVCKKTEGSPKDHVWDKGTVTKPATETAEGVMTYKCAACGKTRTEVIPMLSHTHKYEKKVTAPTCTEQGYTTYTCKCGHSYVDNYTKANGHKAETDKAVVATCTKTGLTAGSHCSVCGVVIKAQEVIPATGHNWDKGTVTKPATEETDGVMTYKCTACGETKTASIPVLSHTHKYEKQVMAPTCTEQGYTTYTCKCGHSYVDNYTKATGHKAETDKAVAASCTKTGLTAGSHCSVCGVTIKAQEVVPATGHSWDQGTVTKPATEEAEGIMTYKCTTCGETKTASIPVLSHTHKYDKVVTAPTCTEQGYTTYTCKCGHSYVDNYTKATGHKAETDKAVPATCTKTGLTAGSHCSVCGVIIKAQETVPAIGHSWDKGTVTKPATEEAEGIMTYKCTACGETKTASIPVLSHTHKYDKAVTAPTCMEQGYTTYTCKCGHSYVDNYTNATGHKAVADAAISATCTKTGLTDGSHCEVCGLVLKAQEIIPETGHSWDTGTVTKPATEEAEGVMTFQCTVCGDSRTESIPALEHVHKYEKETVAASCEKGGYDKFTCACGHGYTENEVEALGHKWVDATCEMPKTCERCGKTEGEAAHRFKDGLCVVCGATQIVAEGEYSDKIRWTLDANGVLTVTGTGELKLELKTIETEDPDAEPVFENAAPWADYADEIKKAVIEEGITELGDGAFLNCPNLEEVAIAASVKTIGQYAFADSEKLHLITFMGDAPVFGKNCFRHLAAYLVYPAENETWTEATLETTGGAITLTDEKPLNPALRPGDVTADGKADYSDALLILRASIGLEELTEEQQSVADVTGDNKFDYGDALLILRRSIGLE